MPISKRPESATYFYEKTDPEAAPYEELRIRTEQETARVRRERAERQNKGVAPTVAKKE